MKTASFATLIAFVLLVACSKQESTDVPAVSYPAITATLGTAINPVKLDEYAGQARPAYIRKDLSATTPISNAKATLGRVLFYDKNLSIDNSISCASCHVQQFAFGDTAVASAGVLGGKTSRHSMRLVNARFANEMRFFWNERAANLQQQTTQPIQDHLEMGFSGQNGRPGISALITKLEAIDYYKELLRLSYGDDNMSESRLQESLSQFILSIQSFDSRFDAGRAVVPNDGAPFPNFTPQENLGKQLFLAPPVFDGAGRRTGGGVGCQGCHRAPEFDIDPLSLNNGITGTLAGVGRELDITRSPTLRDLVRADGVVNGPLMHTGRVTGLRGAIDHYNSITASLAQNPNLDPRLRPNGMGQQLNMTEDEKRAVVAFLQTLGGTNMYTDKKWGNPFR